jgi:hypothetical protein
MYSLETIRSMSREACKKAAKSHKKPYHPELDEIDDWPPFPFPSIGDYLPKGWVEDEDTRWLCDSSGFGSPNEPAYTTDQLKNKIKEYLEDHPEAGFAVVEEGQFQVVLSAFNPE